MTVRALVVLDLAVCMGWGASLAGSWVTQTLQTCVSEPSPKSRNQTAHNMHHIDRLHHHQRTPAQLLQRRQYLSKLLSTFTCVCAGKPRPGLTAIAKTHPHAAEQYNPVLPAIR
jgi:hypothetical protein